MLLGITLGWLALRVFGDENRLRCHSTERSDSLMFAMFTRDLRARVMIVSGAVVAAMALAAPGTGLAAALSHAPRGVPAASASLSGPTAFAVGLHISYSTIDPRGPTRQW